MRKLLASAAALAVLSAAGAAIAQQAAQPFKAEGWKPGLNRSSQRQPELIAARRRGPRPAFSTRGSCAVCC